MGVRHAPDATARARWLDDVPAHARLIALARARLGDGALAALRS
jgi:hypothetical protein